MDLFPDGNFLPKPRCLDDRDFCNWLSGFTDGEGCFQIICNRHMKAGREYANYMCHFMIGLRMDDAEVLYLCKDKTGLGVVRLYPKIDGVHDQARWCIERKRDSLALVNLFDHYPLRAKKRKDYVVWREAAMEWGRVRTNRKRFGYRKMMEMALQLRSLRRYSSDVPAKGEKLRKPIPPIVDGL